MIEIQWGKNNPILAQMDLNQSKVAQKIRKKPKWFQWAQMNVSQSKTWYILRF